MKSMSQNPQLVNSCAYLCVTHNLKYFHKSRNTTLGSVNFKISSLYRMALIFLDS